MMNEIEKIPVYDIADFHEAYNKPEARLFISEKRLVDGFVISYPAHICIYEHGDHIVLKQQGAGSLYSDRHRRGTKYITQFQIREKYNPANTAIMDWEYSTYLYHIAPGLRKSVLLCRLDKSSGNGELVVDDISLKYASLLMGHHYSGHNVDTDEGTMIQSTYHLGE